MEEIINNDGTTVEKAFQDDLDKEIILTDKAKEKILSIIKENNIPNEHGLRVACVGGGCSGLSYKLVFDTEKRNTDKIIDKGGFNLWIDPKSLFYLSGTIIDYTDGLNGKGFTFSNPQSKHVCGCGNSFSI